MFKVTTYGIPALVAFALLMPVASAAQTAGGGDVRRPYRALFGGDPNDATSSSLSISFNGGYEDNVVPRDNAELDPRFQASSLTGGAVASLILQRAGERAAFGVSLTSSLRYIQTEQELMSSGHGANAFTRVRFGERASVNVTGGFMWAPLYNPLLSGSGFGAEGFESFAPAPIGADYSAGSRPATFANGAVNVNYVLTRRASLSGGYGLHYEDYTDEDRQQTGATIRAGASYRVTRYSNLRLSYSRVDHRLRNGDTRGNIDDFSGGIDYRRPLSLSGRRTTFTITPGWAIDRRDGGFRLHATGSATVNHEIGRTWTAKASYRRGFRFADGFDAEMLANTATVSVDGLLSRRVSLGFGGQFVISADNRDQQSSRDYQAYSASSRVSYALTRNMSTYVQYIYYSYQFGNSVVLPASIGRRLDRQGVRVGLSLWAPILR